MKHMYLTDNSVQNQYKILLQFNNEVVGGSTLPCVIDFGMYQTHSRDSWKDRNMYRWLNMY